MFELQEIIYEQVNDGFKYLNMDIMRKIINSKDLILSNIAFTRVLFILLFIFLLKFGFGQNASVELELDNLTINLYNLPNPICDGDSLAILTCNIPNTTNTCNSAQSASSMYYAFAEVGKPIQIDMEVEMTSQAAGFFQVFVDYIPDYGQIPNNVERILPVVANPINTSQDTLNSQLYFKPIEGTTFGVLRFAISGYESGTGSFVWREVVEIPITVLGPADKVIDTLGSFTTPETPYLILHDPPGGGSSSMFQQNIKLCRESSINYEESFGFGLDNTFKAGVKGSAGIILEQDFEISLAITNEFRVSQEKTYESSTQRCIETQRSFTTSELIQNTGQESDLFVVYSERLVYGIFDDVILDENCNPITKKRLSYYSDPGGLTLTVKTKQRLEDDINQLLAIANDMQNDLTVRTDAQNQAELWQQVLTDNEFNIANPDTESGFITPADFIGGGSSIEVSEEISVTEIKSTDITIAIENTTSITAVIEVGANGITGGPQFKYTRNDGQTNTNETSDTKMINYTLQDLNINDDFHVNVYRDPDYGTPIFDLRSTSRTSCPYEGGMRLDLPSFSASPCSFTDEQSDTIFIERESASDTVKLFCQLCNENQTLRRNMTWRLDENLRSIGYQFNGSDNQIQNLGFIEPGDCKNIDMFLFPINANREFNDLVFRLYPACLDGDPALEDALLEESDVMVVNVTFGSTGNYTQDQLTNCPACVPALDLNAGAGQLDGTYTAENIIRVLPGAQFALGGNVTLDAPEVEIQMDNTIPSTTSLHIENSGCQN